MNSKLLKILLIILIIILFTYNQTSKTLTVTVDSEGSASEINDLLDFFDEENITATFFLLGETCEEHPLLCINISKEHDIACHGYAHPKYKKLSSEEIRLDILHGKEIIQNITGKDCVGFRTPYASCTNSEILIETGFEYHSDICMFSKLENRAPLIWTPWASFEKNTIIRKMHWFLNKILFLSVKESVIVMHPQDFKSQQDFDELHNFLELARALNTEIKPFQKV